MIEPTYSSATPEGHPDEATIEAIIERIKQCVKDVSLGFERWDDPRARGPGLYFVIERDSLTEISVPMGNNRWSIEDCASVFAETDALLETAQNVGLSSDGAVVVHGDGTIEAEMVRVKQLSSVEESRNGELPYAGWMGARHMSALETSTREEVTAAITLSEEDGRVTVFTDGTFEDAPAPSLMAESVTND